MTTEDTKAVGAVAAVLCVLCAVAHWLLPASPHSSAAAPAEVREAERLPHGWDVWAPPTKGNQTLVVLRVIDGDTCEAAYLVPVTLRIAGINAPEKNTAAGKKAKLALEAYLAPGLARTWTLTGKERWGRILADTQITQGQETAWLSTRLVNDKMAVPWDGRGPRPKAADLPPDDGQR